jgi:hypothetical protein
VCVSCVSWSRQRAAALTYRVLGNGGGGEGSDGEEGGGTHGGLWRCCGVVFRN